MARLDGAGVGATGNTGVVSDVVRRRGWLKLNGEFPAGVDAHAEPAPGLTTCLSAAKEASVVLSMGLVSRSKGRRMLRLVRLRRCGRLRTNTKPDW